MKRWTHKLEDRPELTLDDPWGIYYTGGTTGLPKGAVLTHGNVTWNSINTTASWGVNWPAHGRVQLPFFHIGGPNIFMVPLVHTGGTTILCSGFDPDETFDLVENCRHHPLRRGADHVPDAAGTPALGARRIFPGWNW